MKAKLSVTAVSSGSEGRADTRNRVQCVFILLPSKFKSNDDNLYMLLIKAASTSRALPLD